MRHGNRGEQNSANESRAGRTSHLDLNLVEGLAVVDADISTDHLRDDNHVANLRLDNGRLLLQARGQGQRVSKSRRLFPSRVMKA